MSYCRFQNTYRDLQDCYEHWEENLSKEEQSAQNRLLDRCEKIVEYYGHGENEIQWIQKN